MIIKDFRELENLEIFMQDMNGNLVRKSSVDGFVCSFAYKECDDKDEYHYYRYNPVINGKVHTSIIFGVQDIKNNF